MTASFPIDLKYLDIWILEAVVEDPRPIRLLDLEPEQMQALWNHPGHGQSTADIIDRLSNLHERGFIQFNEIERTLPFTEEMVQRELLRRRRPIHIDRDIPPDVTWQLTPLRGAVWEQVAEAQWEKYHRVDWPDDWQPDEASATEVNRIRAGSCEQLLAVRFAYVGRPGRWLRDRIELVVERPWEATCWKTLPIVYATTIETPRDSLHHNFGAWSACSNWHLCSRDFRFD